MLLRGLFSRALLGQAASARSTAGSSNAARWPPTRANGVPVLTLRATVVAVRLGYRSETALTLCRLVAGSGARAKAGRLGFAGDSTGILPVSIAHSNASLTIWPAGPRTDRHHTRAVCQKPFPWSVGRTI